MLISCIMPTRGRAEWVHRALACFTVQSWPERELVIVDDADCRSFSAAPDIPLVQYHLMERRLSIGAKRNLACSRAAGDVIAHWDDDDWSAPGRLEDQIVRMSNAGKAVTGYSSMVFDAGKDAWLYRGQPDYAIGSSLMYRRDWWQAHPFRDLRTGEDNAFVWDARQARQIVCADANGMMRASIHPGNTSPRNFWDGDKLRAEWRPLCA